MLDPIDTYRLQLHKDFTFKDMEHIIPYLQQLGVGAIYASPIMRSTPGSMHGYDGVNPLLINPEIGTEEELESISRKLQQHKISWLQDIAPNHMAFNEHNSWLMEVIKNGPESKYGHFFDILWHSPLHDGRLMVPFEGSGLEKILKEQGTKEKYYRLCNWQETDHRINYRRFFIVNELICLNIQHEEVFKTYHEYIGELLGKGVFQGLRIDHIDGLYDPTGYLNRIRELAGDECYIVVEKILQQQEGIPNYWPVQGNTGYDFLSMINNVFTNAASKEAFTAFYENLIVDKRSIQEQVAEKKAHILYHHMQGELDNLTELYKSLGLSNEQDQEEIIKKDISDYLINCPVYRYYDHDIPVMKRDKNKNGPQLEQFYTRCMQFTGPLMAKGVEDTLMYTYNRFIGHNEVGDSPENFGLSCEDFHYDMIKRKENWPQSLNATATHDTKRGEDARARLNVLTDIHEEWFTEVKKWFAFNTDIREKETPDSNDEYFIYQSLIGNYPMPGEEEGNFKDRFAAYLVKALREAKRHSNWAQPNETYEVGCQKFASNLLNKERPFWKSFAALHEKVSGFGIINSLAQIVLKFTCPGVPDIYQGCELWDLSFVDPNNRRPVDYTERRHQLKQIINNINAADTLIKLWKNKYNAQIKLWLTHTLLQERKQHSEVFNKGNYIPLQITGKYGTKILAYARHYQQSWYIIAIPLHLATICDNPDEIDHIDWEDTSIILPTDAPTTWRHLFLDRKIETVDGLQVQKIMPLAVLSNN